LAQLGSNGCRWHADVDEDVSDTEDSVSVTLDNESCLATESTIREDQSPVSLTTHVSATEFSDDDLTCHEAIADAVPTKDERIHPAPLFRSLQDENRTLLWIQDPPLTVIEFLKWTNRGVPYPNRFGIANMADQDVDTFNQWIEHKNHRFL
jgi:hypothetical protein